MATRIPLPGLGADALQRGVESGTGLWQQLIGQGVNLGRMHQQGQQFEKQYGLDERKLAQAWQEHLHNMALRQQAEQRLAQEFEFKKSTQPLEFALLKAKIEESMAKANKANQPVLSEEEKSYQRTKGAQRAKSIAENSEQIAQANDLESSLGELVNIANIDPALFEETIGPVASRTNKYTGTPEQKEMLGNIKAASGNVMLNTLQLMKGASSDREMAEVKEIKPSETDYPEAYKAKAQTLLKVAEQVKNRKIYINEQLENGISSTDAVKNAMERYPVSPLVKSAKTSENSKQKMIKIHNAKTNETKYVTYEEAKKMGAIK